VKLKSSENSEDDNEISVVIQKETNHIYDEWFGEVRLGLE
jgi:hypothetical protein